MAVKLKQFNLFYINSVNKEEAIYIVKSKPLQLRNFIKGHFHTALLFVLTISEYRSRPIFTSFGHLLLRSAFYTCTKCKNTHNRYSL